MVLYLQGTGGVEQHYLLKGPGIPIQALKRDTGKTNMIIVKQHHRDNNAYAAMFGSSHSWFDHTAFF